MDPQRNNNNPVASGIVVVSGVSVSLAFISSSGTSLERLQVGALLLIAVALWSFLFYFLSLQHPRKLKG
jgi:hypothetical protein